ncbi:MAG TPA: DNA-binding protein [Candidatus Marinimicrobia bacterium]|nr:DNA-binding protein [Candidatus Neomarinimicrobiota bacterium]
MTVFKIIEMLERIESKVDGRDRWLSTSEACTYAGVSGKTLRRNVIKGVLKCSTAVGKNLYLKSDLKKWLRQR